MNKEQREVLLMAYNSFDVELDSDDYINIGKIIIIRRRLAELLGLNLSVNILPGEYFDEEDPIEWRFIAPSVETEELSKDEMIFLKETLKITGGVGGCTDSDDACLRCARRMLAEVVEYEPLNHYRLLFEKEMKNIYYKRKNKTDS
jgi:hypothetical protein